MLSMVHLQNSPIRSPLKESHGSFMDGEIDAFQVLLIILFHQPRIIFAILYKRVSLCSFLLALSGKTTKRTLLNNSDSLICLNRCSCSISNPGYVIMGLPICGVNIEVTLNQI